MAKTFDTFDFIAMPGLNKMLVLELARCEYILRRGNIMALQHYPLTLNQCERIVL